MKIEVLVASMNNKAIELVQDMNIRTDFVIANQSDVLSYQTIKRDENKGLIINTPEKGVGRNRNVALDRATGDICLLADDDLLFFDDYENIITELYNEYPKADVIIYNLLSSDSKRYQIPKAYKVNYFNYMRFGAARISFRRLSVTKNGIHFNVHFGGGTEHSAGEDVLFLHECLKKGLNVMAVNQTIAELKDDRPSSWFLGYNEKFFIDRGVLYATISKRFCYFYSVLSAIRHRKQYSKQISSYNALKSMFIGIKQFKSSKGYI